MAAKKLNLTILVLAILALTATCNTLIKPGQGIAARLEGEAGMAECWNALLELKSCSNEIVLFFINGESYLGMDCCRAIRTITHNCWPSMLSSIGYTSEEGDILRDYCGALPPQAAVELMVESPAEAPIERSMGI